MERLSTFSDEELLPRIVAGGSAAFAEFYTRYQQNVCRFIQKYVQSAAMADDLTQEVFIKIWNGREQLNHVRSLKAYLLVTARNHTFNSLKAALRSESALGEVINNFVSLRQPAEERLLDADYQAFLQRELAKLPQRTREIFRLCRQEGLTYEEVATTLGISKSAVKKHMVFSMKVLKVSVEQELGITLAAFLAAIAIP